MKVNLLVSTVTTVLIGMSSTWAMGQGLADSTNDNALPITEDEIANQFYQPLAENGEPYAQLALAEMYSEGDGVAKNLVVAYAWLILASHNGVEEAEQLKNDLLSVMTGGEKVQAKALGSAYIDMYASR